MASRFSYFQLHRRLYTTTTDQWSIKQVRNSNFHGCLGDLKNHISDSDFIALSLQRTGSSSFPWHRPQPFDTLDTAYCKAKYAAEKFQILQFSLCPFSVRDSKLIAHPYNFHLFPRDELNIGMPSYSFSCQVSHLTSIAREGFDFGAWVYDDSTMGLQWLDILQEFFFCPLRAKTAQESIAKAQMGCQTLTPNTDAVKSSSEPSVFDTIFVQRVKSRVKNWKDAYDSSSKTNDALLSTLKKLIVGIEQYGSRPSIVIDVYSERQALLALELLKEFSDDVVPVVISAKSGGTQAIRAILTSSKEDKILLEKELQNLEDEENKKFRGFREVIEMISASQKPIVSYSSLHDFTFIHSKFLAPLPTSIDEFASSLHLVFPRVLEVKHLMSKIGGLSKPMSIAAALSYLKKHYYAPTYLDIPIEAPGNDHKPQGHNAIRLCHLFAKVCSLLKIDLSGVQSNNNECLASMLEKCSNVSSSFSPYHHEPKDEDVKIWARDVRKASCRHLVFLWGFREGMTAPLLKASLEGSHEVFCEEFYVRFVDKKCAIIVFSQPGLSETFLDAINSDCIVGSLREMVSEGLRATGYETYKRMCRFDLWEADLAESLERAIFEADPETAQLDINYSNDTVISLDDL
ncbi:poly(A)-specific ribonuclease PARN-like [Cucumis melo var. makuwa]|uniref:Poly(A)-specific ribonuclease PARN-like n=1 Tax=Cucumis melo var. makuwa TaxID=1194695 RepID=A0A5D3CA51_CUCMM|nr:poly(A)-specific ribonuclease PARN-like [Cucumis melo var. makuwa]